MTNVKAIIIEDGKLTKTESGAWVYTGNRGTFVGPTASEALAKAYNVNPSDVEVKIVKFKDYGAKALVCIEGFCELYDVEIEESTPSRITHRKHESVRTN